MTREAQAQAKRPGPQNIRRKLKRTPEGSPNKLEEVDGDCEGGRFSCRIALRQDSHDDEH